MQAELPEAERQWRGRAASAVLCLRSHCIPLPSLTQMVAWTTSRTPRANQELCPKYLLGRVFFLTLSICLLIFTHLGVVWFHLGLEASKYLERSSAKPLREWVSGVWLWIWGGISEGQVRVTVWRGQDRLRVPEFSALSSTLFLRRKSRAGYKT